MNIRIKTKGMHCSSCEILLKDALEELKGVKKALGNHKKGIVAVDYDEAVITKDKIISAIKKEGYQTS